MITLDEGSLRITLPHDDATTRKFDDAATHGLLHRHMKAVDFMVELQDRLLLIEIKDPEQPDAPADRRAQFVKRFMASEIDNNLMRKLRDSVLYEWACGTDKPVHYWVIVAIDKLTDADLLVRTDCLKQMLPVIEKCPARWQRQIVADCRVFNMRSWNEALPAGYRVQRVEA